MGIKYLKTGNALHQTIRDEQSWILLYGRRKTRKTFTVKTTRKPSLHLVVTRGGSILLAGKGSFKK